MDQSISISAENFKSPAMRLYRDVLQAVCTFIELNEFVRRVAVVSKSWYSWSQTMKPRKGGLRMRSRRQMVLLLMQSPLRIHINRLELSSKLDEKELVLLSERMPHLEVLEFTFGMTCSLPVQFSLPPHLLELTVDFDFAKGLQRITSHDVHAYLKECLKQIAAQATSLRKLIVRHQTTVTNEIDCPHELRTIQTLTEIELPRQFEVLQYVDLVKSLPNIRRWVPRHSRLIESIQRLTEGSGSPVGLQDIGPLYRVDEPEAAQLRRLVQLSQLELNWMILPDPTQLLPFFPHLSVLTLSCEVSVRLDLLVTALSSCVSITCLNLCHDQLASSHLSQFLPSMINLIQLRLNDCENIRNLKFLNSTTGTSTPALQTFEITGIKSIPLKEYDHLSSIGASLEYLAIGESCGSRWSDSMIARFTPNSATFRRSEWPRLVQFTLMQNSKY